jgi:NAD(P)-dependent dehydrogenase (short-subunit alcohol dehydrogenase family)
VNDTLGSGAEDEGVDASPIRFDGEVAIVTGAGNGLGRSYALELASRGAAVVCNDIVASAAEATSHEITRRGGSALAETSSVATPAGGQAIVSAALDAFGSLDIVVNNAGQLRNAPFEDLAIDDFRAVLDTHLTGAFFVTQPAYRHMKAAGYGRVVFTSSSAGMFGMSWQANYAAAKAGLVGLCNVVALEGAPHGIKANAIMPMALTGIGSGGPPPYSAEDLRATTEALRPLAPYMTVDNVAPLVVYLASRRCSETRRVFSVGCGNVARVFVGVARGWCATGFTGMTPEEVEANLDSICDLTDFGTPESMNDASRFIAQHLPEVGGT